MDETLMIEMHHVSSDKGFKFLPWGVMLHLPYD